ncbi:MAG: hypothetical protein ACOCU1_02305 [Bacillota bacterium]
MDDIIYPKINLKILSQRLRDIRTDNDYSLRGISRSENIAHTVISDIENGKIYPNVETLKGLYARVNVNLLIDEKKLEAYKEIFETIKDSVYYSENNMVITLMKKVRKDAHTLTHSLIFVDFLLVCALNDIVIKKHKNSEHLDKLESYYALLSDRQKIEFNLLKGMVNHKRHAFRKAAMYYERNLTLKGYKKALAMTYSHLSRLYKQTYHTYNTIEYGKIASRLHSEEANLYEKLNVDALVANELINIGRFDDAKQVLNTVSITVEQKNGKLEIIQRYLHFLWSYWFYKQGDYEEAYKRLLIHTSNEPSYYYYQANILEKMNRIDEAIDVLDNASRDTYVLDDPLYKHLVLLYMYDLSKAYDHPNFKKTLSNTLDNEHYVQDYVIYKHIHEISLRYYGYHNMQDDALALMQAFFDREMF